MHPVIFSRLVDQALKGLPPEFLEKMENVDVMVEDLPDWETVRSLDLGSPYELLGIYMGVPITQKSVFVTNPVPDRIILYRLPILAQAATREEIVTAIRDVLVHEVGHHFGFDDRELDEMMESSS